MNKTLRMIDEHIRWEMAIVDDRSLTDEDRENAMRNVERLHKLRVAELEHISDDNRLEKWLNRGLETVKHITPIVGGWIVYDKWQARGLLFERTGTVVSPWVKSLIGKLPK